MRVEWMTGVDVFFQAEDGIRDRTVTGVQTCALPIWRPRRPPCGNREPGSDPAGSRGAPDTLSRMAGAARPTVEAIRLYRSEERRVGKESRYKRPRSG